MANPEYADLPFVRPRAWGSGRAGYSVQVIVVHYTAGSERSTSAEDGAAYDARRTDGTSTHYFVDSNSVVQCVETWNRANAALRMGNRIGVQYELCGTQQSRAQWLDAASDATLTNAARQIARDCQRYGIPPRWLSPAQVRAGLKGICGHADITLAFPEDGGDHMDPGAAFPRDVLLARVQQHLNPAPAQPGHPEEEDDVNSLVYALKKNPGSATTQVWALAGLAAGPAGWVETDKELVATGWAIRFGGPTKDSVHVPEDDWAWMRQQHRAEA